MGNRKLHLFLFSSFFFWACDYCVDSLWSLFIYLFIILCLFYLLVPDRQSHSHPVSLVHYYLYKVHLCLAKKVHLCYYFFFFFFETGIITSVIIILVWDKNLTLIYFKCMCVKLFLRDFRDLKPQLLPNFTKIYICRVTHYFIGFPFVFVTVFYLLHKHLY